VNCSTYAVLDAAAVGSTDRGRSIVISRDSPNQATGEGISSSIGEERDLAGQERDEAGDRRDKAADQRDDAGDQRDQAGDERDEAADERDHVADKRDRASRRRDEAGRQRDEAADERDRASDLRDKAAEQSEGGLGAEVTTDRLSRVVLARREAAADRRQASQDRRAGASERAEAEQDRDTALADRGAGARERAKAEHDRDTALADRGAGAEERTKAEHDRDTALADRGASATERASGSRDALTGVYLRGAGSQELEHEIARARRTSQPLVVAFIDVDHLKATNDRHGHAAGDRLLLAVASTLRAELRPYDLIFRYGGDEFVCALSGPSRDEARERFAHLNIALARSAEHGSVTVGLAELQPDDSAEELVARADAALYQERQQQRHTGTGDT